MTEPSSSARALPVLAMVGGIWGGSFLFIKVLVDETGPLEVVAGRLTLGALAVTAYTLLSGRRVRLSPALLAHVCTLAVLTNIIPFGLISWAEQHIQSGTASILNATVPIFTALFAAIILSEERFTPARITGLILGFAGVAVLTGSDVLDVTSSSVLGELAVVSASACYGVGAVYSRNLLRDQDPAGLSMLQLIAGAVISVPLVFIFSGTPDYALSAKAFASLVALGVLGTGLAYVGYLWLIDNIGSVRASLATYIVPVIAVVLGWLVLDESIGANTVIGGLLIIAGVASVLRGQAPVRRKAGPGTPATGA